MEVTPIMRAYQQGQDCLLYDVGLGMKVSGAAAVKKWAQGLPTSNCYMKPTNGMRQQKFYSDIMLDISLSAAWNILPIMWSLTNLKKTCPAFFQTQA